MYKNTTIFINVNAIISTTYTRQTQSYQRLYTIIHSIYRPTTFYASIHDVSVTNQQPSNHGQTLTALSFKPHTRNTHIHTICMTVYSPLYILYAVLNHALIPIPTTSLHPLLSLASSTMTTSYHHLLYTPCIYTVIHSLYIHHHTMHAHIRTYTHRQAHTHMRYSYIYHIPY